MHTRQSSRTFDFVRHYVEMVIATFLGMFVLGAAGALLLGALGLDVEDWRTEAIERPLLAMAVTMSAPMVAWMRHRGHGRRRCWEMAGSMFVPSVAAIALLWGGLGDDAGTLLAIQHVGMFPSMLAAMLLRREEYTGHMAHARMQLDRVASAPRDLRQENRWTGRSS